MSDLFGYNGEAPVCAGSMHYFLSSSSRNVVALSTDEVQSISISGETVTIDLSYALTSTFYIVAEAKASSKLTYQKVELTVEEVVLNLPPPVNKPPTFEGDVETQLDVEVVVGADGEIEDGSIVEYTSPKAVDPEEDDIELSISGNDGLDWMSFTVNDDGSFTLSCDRSLLTEESAGDHALTISLGDSENQDSTSISITVTITIEKETV